MESLNKIFFIVVILIVIPSVNAGFFGFNNPDLPKIDNPIKLFPFIDNRTLFVNNSINLGGLNSSSFWQRAVTQFVGTDKKFGNIIFADNSAINAISVNQRFLADNAIVSALNWQLRTLYRNIANSALPSQDFQNGLFYGIQGQNPNMNYNNDSGIEIFDSLGINTAQHYLDTQLYIKGQQFVDDCAGSITLCSDLSLNACNSFPGCSTDYCFGNKVCSGLSDGNCQTLESYNVCTRTFTCDGTLDCTVYGYDDCNARSGYCLNGFSCNDNPNPDCASQGQAVCESYPYNVVCTWNTGSSTCDPTASCGSIPYNDCNSVNGCSQSGSCSTSSSCSNIPSGECTNYNGCSLIFSSCTDGGNDCSFIGNSPDCSLASCTYVSGSNCGNINGGLSNPDCSQLIGTGFCTPLDTNGYCSLNQTIDFRNLVVQAGVDQTNDTFQCLDSAGNKNTYITSGCGALITQSITGTQLLIQGGQSFLNGEVYTRSIFPITANTYDIGFTSPYNRSRINYLWSLVLNSNNLNSTNINSTRIITQNITSTFFNSSRIIAKNISSEYINVSGNLIIGGNLSAKIPYAVFTDNTTQGMASTAVGQVMNFSTIDDNYEINLVNKQNITVNQPGDYHFIVSAIATCANNNKHINIWWQKNGVNVPRSNTLQEINTANVEALMTVPFIIDLNRTDNLRIMWNSDDTGCSLKYTTNNSFIPETPSIILTINRIGDITP